jgi:5-oxoprolinase (ATP-hydrolysing) subunit A
MQPSIDFNCDLGEGATSDAEIIALISSASIACGMHAGDAPTMRDTVALCLAHGVAIGAHPSYPDREDFGRRDMSLAPADIEALVLYQVGALDAIVRAAGGRLHHVKPHGALYNRAADDRAVADAIAAAVQRHDPALRLYALSRSALADAGSAIGLQVVHEVFAERRYDARGRLLPRSAAGAVIEDVDAAIAPVAGMLIDGHVTAHGGAQVPIRADTLCLHGDRPDAAAFARALRRALQAAGVAIERPCRQETRR